MTSRIVVMVAAMAAASAALATSLGVPDEATVAAVEGKVRLPSGAHRLADYDRYYAYETDDGRLMIVGEYVALGLNRPGRIQRLDDPSRMPLVTDGGYSIIHVRWDVKLATVTAIGCNGLA